MLPQQRHVVQNGIVGSQLGDFLPQHPQLLADVHLHHQQRGQSEIEMIQQAHVERVRFGP
jgi:hypothetical protein